MKAYGFSLLYFAWAPVAAALFAAYLAYGLPHLIWAYRWLDQGQGYDPFAPRHYTSCTYVGPYGVFEMPAEAGDCAWLVFRKSEDRGPP